MAQTVKIVFQKRTQDGTLRQITPLYDSSSGVARMELAIEYARMLRVGCEAGTLTSKGICDLEPNHVMTAYVATTHMQRTHIELASDDVALELDPGMKLDTMALGYGEWLGDVRQVLFCCIDLDSDLSSDALVVEEEPWYRHRSSRASVHGAVVTSARRWCGPIGSHASSAGGAITRTCLCAPQERGESSACITSGLAPCSLSFRRLPP